MIVNKCKKCNKEFEASTKIKYCSKNCAYNVKENKKYNVFTAENVIDELIKLYDSIPNKPIV